MSMWRTRHSRVAAVAALALAGLSLSSAPVASASSHDAEDGGYLQLNLFSNQPGRAAVTDPNLVNGWGMSQGPTTPVWVSDNGADVTTLYTGAGVGKTPARVPLVVKIPDGAPTGQVFNATTSFVLSNGLPARFIFAGEHGSISAWNPTLSPNTAALPEASSAGAVFKGMALLVSPSGPQLLLADFGHGRIAVYDSAFHAVATPSWAFTDPKLPKGYEPFNVAVLAGRVYVSYALRDPATLDDVAGRGHGFVDVYGADGTLLKRLARRGALNSPWGLAIAPAGFGALSGDLLVGNFGDGRIHAFDPATGEKEGTLRDPMGKPIVIDGLWGLLPGNGTSADTTDVWFSAGPDGEANGLVGVLRAAPPKPEGSHS